MFDWIVVGAGFSGSVVARELAENSNQRILIIDRRSHVGGNAFDFINEHGHRIHPYGPHIFHTNSQKVFDYLSRFTDWYPYEHIVHGNLKDGKIVPIPFNLSTLELLDTTLSRQVSKLLGDSIMIGDEIPVQKLMESTNPTLRRVGELAFSTIFKGYSEKQWGRPLQSLSPSVGARVPVRFSYDNRYFLDQFQFMPADGYSVLFENLLDHSNIQIQLEKCFNPSDYDKDQKIIFTGQIDELHNFELGELPYRSLEFSFQHQSEANFQTTAQVNFTQSEEFTRITEFSKFTGLAGEGSTIAHEFPIAHLNGKTVPYYPIPQDANSELHAQYLELTKTRFPNLKTLGRLADYKYFNMDQVVAKALQISAVIASELESKL